MTETKPPQRNPQNPEQGRDGQNARRPRGFGGVLLIMALLLALFVMISNSGNQKPASIYDLQAAAFRGRVEATEFKDGSVIARVVDDGTEPKARTIEVTLPLDETVASDRQLIRDLVPYFATSDRNRYAGTEMSFADDLGAGYLIAEQAHVVSLLPRPVDEARPESSDESEETKPQTFLSVIATVRGELNPKLFVVPAKNRGQLDTAIAALESKSVPITRHRLATDPQAFRIERSNTSMFFFLSTIGPWILVLLIVWFFLMRQMRSPGGSGGVLSFGRSRAALYTKENRTNVTFDDVAGIEEAKGELREIIEFLKNPQKFAKLGGSIPRGVLLVGSPGTGKTLLAKAIAGEAEVPFFSISGSDFVEMFVGVGASRVRDLFKQARENSPCIVFLDEIDAVGRKRGSGMGGGHDEREQTLNAILVEMDGFDSDKGTILIAATNRPDVLDPALMRPGRFDRQVTIDMPDANGREHILRVHARKVKLRSDVDLAVIARATPGFSGAELAALMNEAAILAAMGNKDAIDLSDLEEARDRVRFGREKRSRKMDEDDLRVTAYHEAGHALVSALIPDQDPVHKVTIVSRGMALGLTMSLPERDDYHQRRSKLLGRIAVCYGGRIAEEIIYGEISAGAQNDIEQATNLAKVMVCELGMSKKVGPINYTQVREQNFLGRDFSIASDVSEQTLQLINDEIRTLCDQQYQRATEILQTHRKELDAVAEGLLRYETLSGDEVSVILRGDDLEEFRRSKEREKAPPPIPGDSGSRETEGRDEPDVGLSGAEGLAHP
ncbi:MAG: ATP-dependent zinc metalloprotease FtsH [Planctomycetota bacterium]